MTPTPKNIQQFVDQIDWPKLRAQKKSLLSAADIAELFGRPKTKHDLDSLVDLIDCLQVVAENEGYPSFGGKVKT